MVDENIEYLTSDGIKEEQIFNDAFKGFFDTGCGLATINHPRTNEQVEAAYIIIQNGGLPRPLVAFLCVEMVDQLIAGLTHMREQITFSDAIITVRDEQTAAEENGSVH